MKSSRAPLLFAIGGLALLVLGGSKKASAAASTGGKLTAPPAPRPGGGDAPSPAPNQAGVIGFGELGPAYDPGVAQQILMGLMSQNLEMGPSAYRAALRKTSPAVAQHLLFVLEPGRSPAGDMNVGLAASPIEAIPYGFPLSALDRLALIRFNTQVGARLDVWALSNLHLPMSAEPSLGWIGSKLPNLRALALVPSGTRLGAPWALLAKASDPLPASPIPEFDFAAGSLSPSPLGAMNAARLLALWEGTQTPFSMPRGLNENAFGSAEHPEDLADSQAVARTERFKQALSDFRWWFSVPSVAPGSTSGQTKLLRVDADPTSALGDEWLIENALRLPTSIEDRNPNDIDAETLRCLYFTAARIVSWIAADEGSAPKDLADRLRSIFPLSR